MKMELIIANKSSGQMWNVANSAQEISWETNRTGSPGTLKFSLIKAGDISFTEGDVVRFSVDGQLQFYGWVFTKVKNRWGVIQITCYDRLRYLKANASYAFYGQKAGDIIRQIAADLAIECSQLVDTGYAIPSLIEQEQSCLDIIQSAVQKTLLNTGKVFVFYDDGNGLALQEAAQMLAPVMIGEKSGLTEYDYKTDIDSQTYNSVKLARPNEATGGADVFEVQDSANIGQWGLLRLYQTVDGDVNQAQVEEQAKVMLRYYNRRLRSLSVEALGVPGLRAGQMLLMQVPGLGDINLDQRVLLERVQHTWKNDSHTMSFDTLSI